MKLVRLSRYTFARRYENVGYIYNQLSHNDMVLDEVGAEFLHTIGRDPISIDVAANKLYLKFSDVPNHELEEDFVQFVSELENEGFVVTGKTEEILNDNDTPFSYSSHPSTNKKTERDGIADSQDFLIEHFKDYPRPFRAHIELTTKCNLECVHCYFPNHNSNQEISKEVVFSFLDQINSMGTLEVVFTGGEPLLRKDLIQILSYARKKDLSVILLTNGTLLENKIINSLKKLNLALVQISLYSMDPVVHDGITGNSNSWNKTVKAINTLVANDIRVEIACPILRENINSYQQVIEYGSSIGIPVSNDLAIMAKEDFSRDNIDHRIDVTKIHNVVMNRSKGDEPHAVGEKSSRKYRPNDPVCGMGFSLMCLSANGNYYPCPGFRIPLGNVHKDTAIDVWNKSPEIAALRNITNSSFPKCMNCDCLDFCIICPAKFYNESGGDLFKVAGYYCEIAKAEKVAQAIKSQN